MASVMVCAAKGCICRFDPASAVESEGQSYCSLRCSEGRGCDHRSCNCGAYPTEEPARPPPEGGGAS